MIESQDKEPFQLRIDLEVLKAENEELKNHISQDRIRTAPQTIKLYEYESLKEGVSWAQNERVFNVTGRTGTLTIDEGK